MAGGGMRFLWALAALLLSLGASALGDSACTKMTCMDGKDLAPGMRARHSTKFVKFAGVFSGTAACEAACVTYKPFLFYKRKRCQGFVFHGPAMDKSTGRRSKRLANNCFLVLEHRSLHNATDTQGNVVSGIKNAPALEPASTAAAAMTIFTSSEAPAPAVTVATSAEEELVDEEQEEGTWQESKRDRAWMVEDSTLIRTWDWSSINTFAVLLVVGPFLLITAMCSIQFVKECKLFTPPSSPTKAVQRHVVHKEAKFEEVTQGKPKGLARGLSDAEIHEEFHQQLEACHAQLLAEADHEPLGLEPADMNESRREVETEEESEREARMAAELAEESARREEEERTTKALAEAERVAKEEAEAERVAKEEAEAERVAKEEAEAERVAKEEADAERVAKEEAEAERVAKEEAEAERVAKEQAEAERKEEEERVAEARRLMLEIAAQQDAEHERSMQEAQVEEECREEVTTLEAEAAEEANDEELHPQETAEEREESYEAGSVAAEIEALLANERRLKRFRREQAHDQLGVWACACVCVGACCVWAGLRR